MALPPGLTPKTVSIGIASFTDGSLAEGTATITAPVNLVHGPTNRPIFSSQMSKRFVDGEVSFDLLPTDAPGLNRVDWTYKLNVTVSGALTQPEPIWFVLPTAGPDEIDLDGLVTVPSSAGTPISVDVLTTEDLPGHMADVAADSDSEFAVAQRAAFGRANPKALIDNLPTPFYIAHRMGTDQSAEESMTAARIAVAQGAHVLEVDMRMLSDGTLVVHHDATVDRTTTGTGAVPDFALPSWLRLRMDHAGLMGGTGWPDEPPLTVEQVLREFGNKVALAPQPYVAGAYAAFERLVTALGIDRDTIILQPITTPDATAAIAAGYRCMAIAAAEPTTQVCADLKAAGYWAIAPDVAVTTQAAVTAGHAAGLKVVPYSSAGHFTRNKMLALGVDGMFTESPGYSLETFAPRTTDNFAAQVATLGTAPTDGSGTLSFQAPNILRLANKRVRLGYLVPPDPSNYTLTFDARVTVEGAGGAIYVFAMKSDFFSTDSRTTQNGVLLDASDGYRFAANTANPGLFGILITDNVGGANVMTSGASNYALNTWATYRLTVTPTQLKWEQVGVSGPVLLNRAEHRPLRYIGLGASTLATAEFRNLVLS